MSNPSRACSLESGKQLAQLYRAAPVGVKGPECKLQVLVFALIHRSRLRASAKDWMDAMNIEYLIYIVWLHFGNLLTKIHFGIMDPA